MKVYIVICLANVRIACIKISNMLIIKEGVILHLLFYDEIISYYTKIVSGGEQSAYARESGKKE